jgi:hypothetical protein
VSADQPGNATYQPAPQVTQSFNVLPPLLGQTISFAPLADRALSAGPFSLTATATSGLAVQFTSLTTGVCTVSGSTVTLVAVGTCTIEAAQPGDLVYAAASPVQQSFAVMAGSGGGGGPGGSTQTVPLPAWALAGLAALLAATMSRARAARSRS